MKNKKFWAVLLLLVCMLALTGCRCVPSEQLWYIQGFEGKETFVNGVELVPGVMVLLEDDALLRMGAFTYRVRLTPGVRG